jgi:hypothetical protein
LSRAGGSAASAAARSSGTTSASTSSSSVHEPSACARRTDSSPGSAIAPAAVSRSTRALLVRAQPLPGFRGVNRSIDRSSSTVPAVLSTQP